MARAVLITTHPGLVARLLPVFPAAGMDAIVVGPPSSYLRHSRYVDRFLAVPDEPAARTRAYRWLVEEFLREDDWVIPGTDDVIWSILDRAHDEATAVRLLPVASGGGLSALDSKVGMAEACQAAGVPQPAFRVARDVGQIHSLATELGYPVGVKVGRSAAGGGVQVLRSPRDEVRFRDTKRPLLVEKWRDGAPVSLDAVFRKGELRCLVAAEGLDALGENGVRVARRYVDLHDDALVKSLQSLAATLGLDGFANASAIRDSDGLHHVFEVDMRPNMWHAYLPGVGVDVSAVLGEDRHAHETPLGLSSPTFPATVRCWSRGWIYAASPRGLRTIPRLLDRMETLDHRQQGDWRMLPGETVVWSRRLARHLTQGVNGRISSRSRTSRSRR